MHFKYTIVTLAAAFYMLFSFNTNKPAIQPTPQKDFNFDSTWYHKTEDSLWNEIKAGKAQSGKVYTIQGHEFSWAEMN